MWFQQITKNNTINTMESENFMKKNSRIAFFLVFLMLISQFFTSFSFAQEVNPIFPNNKSQFLQGDEFEEQDSVTDSVYNPPISSEELTLTGLEENSVTDLVYQPEKQLEKVIEYYDSREPLTIPMEMLARFAIGEDTGSYRIPDPIDLERAYYIQECIPNSSGYNSGEYLFEGVRGAGINVQTWLSQIILDLLAAGEDPANYKGRDYISQLMQYQQSRNDGLFTSSGNNPGSSDGLAILALMAYWGDNWPTDGISSMGKIAAIEKINEKIPSLLSRNFNSSDNTRFQNGREWGLGKTPQTRTGEITFYNNFWLSQALALYGDENAADNVKGIADTFNTDVRPRQFAIIRKEQCELQAAYIITALSAGIEIEDEEWKTLAKFQLEDGSYKRREGDIAANGEATAMATIALDYAKRIANGEDRVTSSAFARLNSKNHQERQEARENIEAILKDKADLKSSIGDIKNLQELLNRIKAGGTNGSTLSFNSSAPHILDPSDLEINYPSSGEPDAAIELNVSIKKGNGIAFVKSNIFLLESEDKFFPFEKNMRMLQDFYPHYKTNITPIQVEEGLVRKWEAVSVVSLTNDPGLEGIAYNVPYYGTPGSYEKTTQYAPESAAIIDLLAMGENPKEYQRQRPGTGEIEEVDLIEDLLNKQVDEGVTYSGGTPVPAGSFYSTSIVNAPKDILAIEAFFGGDKWGNEEEGTKLGRIGAIEFILGEMKDWEYVEGGRIFHRLAPHLISVADGYRPNSNDLLAQAEMVILLSRWLEDETLVTINGKEEVLKDIAQREIEGLLTTLKGVYFCNYIEQDKKMVEGFSETLPFARYISALVASGNRELVDEYQLWDQLRNGRLADGTYMNFIDFKKSLLWIGIERAPDATAAVAMAMGDYHRGDAILATLSYDKSTVTDEDAVTKDLAALKLPESVTGDMELPSKGFYGSDITWYSSHEDIINPTTGAVKRPELGENNIIVTLIAEVTKGDTKETREFTVIVLAKEAQEETDVKLDWYNLDIPLFLMEGNIELIQEGTNGSDITWTSSNPQAISPDGVVSYGEEEVYVTLTADISKGNFSKTKEFKILVSKKIDDTDIVEKAMAQLRKGYNTKRSLTGSYWDIWAAKSVLGDHFENYNFDVYDVKSHRPGSAWQGTDYGGVVLQILAQGDNPYNYRGINYVKLLQEYVDKGWGGWGAPIFAAMALDAAAADPEGYGYDREGISGFFIGQLDNLQYGPDLAGWSLIPLATELELHGDKKGRIIPAIDKFKHVLKISQEIEGDNKGLFNTGGVAGGILTLSNGCVVSGFAAMEAVGQPGFDLTQDEWKIDGIGVLEAIYDKEIKGKEDFSKISNQLILEFGDIYYGDSVWRRVGVKPEDFTSLIKEAEPLIEIGKDKYTENSYKTLVEAYENALTVKNNSDKMANNYFGQAHFTLRDAIKGLRETDASDIDKTELEEIIITAKAKVNNAVVGEKPGNYPQEAVDTLIAVIEEGNRVLKDENATKEEVENIIGALITAIKVFEDSIITKEPSKGGHIILTVEKFTLGQGYIKEPIKLPFRQGDNVAKLLTDFLGEGKYRHSGNINSGFYLSSIYDNDTREVNIPQYILDKAGKITSRTSPEWLGEFDYTSDSGWMYAVNNEFLGIGMSEYIVKDGDVIRVQFSVHGIGADIGGGLENYIKPANKDKLTAEIAEINSNTDKDKLLSKEIVNVAYNKALEVLQDMESSQEGVDKALKDLKTAIEGIEEPETPTTYTITFELSPKDAKVVVKDKEGKEIKAEKDKTYQLKSGNYSYTVSATGYKTKTDSFTVKDTAKTIKVDLVKTSSGGGSTGGGGSSGGGGTSKAQDKDKVKYDKSTTVKDKEVTIEIPANAMEKDFKVNISKVRNISKLPIAPDKEIVGNVFEITKDKDGNFKKTVTITLPYNKTKVDFDKQDISLYWLNEKTDKWIELDNVKVNKSAETVTGEIDHFTKFAVLATQKATEDIKVEDTQKPEEVEKLKVVTSPIDIKGHWAEKHINRLINTGAISGYPDGSFKPDNNITRAEFATILVKALNLEEKTGKDFKDTKNHWARKYISTAQAHGIISGYDENTFGAEDLITREQMAVMIAKAKKLEKFNKTETFIDSSSISSWAKTAVELASGNDIMKVYPEGDFKPQNKATRAEAVTVIVKIL